MRIPRLIPVASILVLTFAVSLRADPVERLSQDSRSEPVIRFAPDGITPSVLGRLSVTLPGKTPPERALAFTGRYRELLLPGDAKSEVLVNRVLPTRYGHVTQMKQWLEGFEVYGAGLQVAEDDLHQVRFAVNSLVPLGTKVLHRELAPREVAVRHALDAFHAGGNRTRDEAEVSTVWFSFGEDLAKVHLVKVPGREPLGDFTYLVARPEGQVVYVFQSGPLAQGYAYLSNPANDTYQQVELPHLTSTEHLTGEHVTVYNCAGVDNCNGRQQLASPDGNGDYLIEPVGANDPAELTDHFVEVQAYYGVNAIHDYFVGVGFSPTPIEIEVNYPMSSPNAMYGNNKIQMGQSSYLDMAVENDVIFHEYGHHVFGSVSSASPIEMDDYGPVSHGLAINEGTADYYSSSALDDPEVAEYFAETMGPAYFPEGWMRNVDNELTCPLGLYGEAHDDSMIWSGFLWDVRALIGQEQADAIYLEVLDAFPNTIKFPTVTQVYLETAALTLDAMTMDQIQGLVDQRGIEHCERFLPLGEEHTGFVWGKELLGAYGASLDFIPAELHYFIEIPADATHLNISWTSRPSGTDVALLVREDERIRHSISWIPIAINSTYDFILEDDVDVDLPSANPAFQPGHTYYLHPVNRGDKTGEYTVMGGHNGVETDGGTDGGSDGGTTDAGDDDTADGGGDGPPDCGEGYDAAWDGEKWVCVPLCKEGYEPKLEGDTWVCAAKSSGCGCATTPDHAALAVFLGLVLVVLLRRRASAIKD